METILRVLGKSTAAAAPPVSKLPPLSSLVVFVLIALALIGLYAAQTKDRASAPRWLPATGSEKHEYEVWVLRYSVVWMGAFAVVVAFQIYEYFGAASYFIFCGGLALPLLLQPLIFRGPRGLCAASVGAQHAARAQLWIAAFGFIGNYWYTHYFYCVLHANYTMPAWRLNDVPIAMYAGTHFYFTSYHVFANLPLRHLRTTYLPGIRRDVLEVALVLAMSYATAFMETLTISHFPYYDFEDREMAYTVGSAFYGLYFVVSFPVYYRLDEPGQVVGPWHRSVTPLRDAAASALASGMAVLLLLDITRLAVVGTPLHIGGRLWEMTDVTP